MIHSVATHDGVDMTIVVMRDVTDRAQALERLAQS